MVVSLAIHGADPRDPFVEFTGYSQVDILGLRYTAVNFGAEKSLIGEPK